MNINLFKRDRRQLSLQSSQQTSKLTFSQIDRSRDFQGFPLKAGIEERNDDSLVEDELEFNKESKNIISDYIQVSKEHHTKSDRETETNTKGNLSLSKDLKIEEPKPSANQFSGINLCRLKSGPRTVKTSDKQ